MPSCRREVLILSAVIRRGVGTPPYTPEGGHCEGEARGNPFPRRPEGDPFALQTAAGASPRPTQNLQSTP